MIFHFITNLFRVGLKKFGFLLVYKGQEHALCDMMVDTDFHMKLGVTFIINGNIVILKNPTIDTDFMTKVALWVNMNDKVYGAKVER